VTTLTPVQDLKPTAEPEDATILVDLSDALIDRELSWLAFARRVLALADDQDLPLFERIKFVGIMGMLHDEFFMKRVSGIKRKLRRWPDKLSLDGRSPAEELETCRAELVDQSAILEQVFERDIRPALAREDLPILAWDHLDEATRDELRRYFEYSVLPILTPLAVDAEHPFPFISDDALNLAVTLPLEAAEGHRFVRIKVPDNRPRWVPLSSGGGFVPLEEVIAANLDLLFPTTPPESVFPFRVTRGTRGAQDAVHDLSPEEAMREPGSIVRQVSNELKARRFAGVVRLEVDSTMPAELCQWLALQLGIDDEDLYRNRTLLRLSDLLDLEAGNRPHLRVPAHKPRTHPRLCGLSTVPSAIFDEIRRGDILCHHPYHSFDTSVLRFIESAAVDPATLAIKLTIYRTSTDSPIVQAVAEAARRGKQAAVLVEITARFDEAPNIAWGRFLEGEGVHVAYGVEKLKTHVKGALVVREEDGHIRRYAHVGTGNYHSGTARIYEDLGVLTCNPEICADMADVFNELTGATHRVDYRQLLVAPVTMRPRFLDLIRQEAEYARAGREAGIRAKVNQLQDKETIQELCRASQAGVPIEIIVRGMCCLRPGVPGLSENIRISSVLGRFLEHSRIYRFANGGDPLYFIGSADWMKRNLSRRVETIMPVFDPTIQRELEGILDVYTSDNSSAWDAGPDGTYERRRPAPGEPRRAAQEVFIEMADSSNPTLPDGEREGASVNGWLIGARPGQATSGASDEC
jgi:polyphosphate kinase